VALVRILVVDDFLPWHGTVSRILSADPELWVIDTALSGHEALAKIQLLKPDVVLLDVEMPEMNGIQAARQITKIAPATRIIFLSAVDCAQIKKTAMETGASGFVDKLNASYNLVPTIKAALRQSSSKTECR
jgi:two-component system chemotaxis response regulator CheB